MLPSKGNGAEELNNFFWMIIYIQDLTINNYSGQLNNPVLHDDRSQMSKKATGEMSLFLNFIF